MKIISLEVEGLHGYLNHNITFHEDLTVLVGINGSGKTSLFQLIDNILKFDVANLCVTKLTKAKLKFIWNNLKHEITITQNNSRMTVYLTVARKKYPSVYADLLEGHISLAANPGLKDELLEHYSRLMPEENEKRTWNYLKELKRPTFVSLDRKIMTDDDLKSPTSSKANRSGATRYEQNGPVIRSLIASKSIYTKYRNELKRLNDELLKETALALFDDDLLLSSDKKSKKINEAEIEKLEKRVLKHPSFLSENDEKTRTKIHAHFSLTKSLMRESEGTKIGNDLRMLLSQRLHSIKKSIDAFDKNEIKANQITEPIKNYLNALNGFLNGSNKRVFFDDADNGLYFEASEDPGKTPRDLTTLSSGEKQMFILLSYLAFISNESGLLMIDEPELSLHPAWQKRFVESIESLRPNGCQIILATHSPEIAGPKRSKTIILKSHSQ